MSSPGISVIICTYNRKDVLERALAAYRNQTFRDFEVIVTSDGSSDGTDEMMEALRGQSGYPLHYIRQADNGFRKVWRSIRRSALRRAGFWSSRMMT